MKKLKFEFKKSDKYIQLILNGDVLVEFIVYYPSMVSKHKLVVEVSFIFADIKYSHMVECSYGEVGLVDIDFIKLYLYEILEHPKLKDIKRQISVNKLLL